MKNWIIAVVGLITTLSLKAQKPENIVIISIDGYRWGELFEGADSSLLKSKKYNSQDSVERMNKYWADDVQERRRKLMPFFWNTIGKEGQLYGNRTLGNLVNVKNPYWISYPGRNENLTGYADTLVKYNSHPDNANYNILEFLDQQKKYKGKVVTFACWDVVAKVINRKRNGLLVNIPGEDIAGRDLTEEEKQANELQHIIPSPWGAGVRLDGTTYAMAKAYIKAHHPKVVYIDFGDTDEFAHHGQYDEYLAAAYYTDAMIGRLWNEMQNDKFYKGNTIFFIVPDHGRGEGRQWTDHGSSVKHASETWFAVLGAGIPAKGEIKSKGQIYQDQFATTITQLLGFTFKTDKPVGESLLPVLNP